MKVLITGGAGYIGNELTYRLSADEGIDEILVYDNLTKANFNLFTGLRKLPRDNVRFIRGDILDSRSLKTALEGVDVVFHLAAKGTTPFADQNPHEFEQVNHWGTAELVYALEEMSSPKVIYLSTTDVYGDGAVESTDHPRDPNSYYGISKMRGEDHMLRLMKKENVYVIRCSNVYGYSKNLRVESLINQSLFDAHFENRIAVHGDRKQSLACISVERVANTLANLVRSDLKSGVYNLSHRNMTVLEIVETLKQLHPQLETLFVDQHLPMKILNVKADERLNALCGLPETSLYDDLLDFEKMFTF